MKQIIFNTFLFTFILSSLSQASDIFRFEDEPVPPGITLQKLAEITNDRDAKLTNLSLMLNKNKLVEGIYANTKREGFESIFETKKNVFWMRDIESREGAVLYETQGKKALILQGALERDTQVGSFNLNYLANGIFGNYESCKFNLKKTDQGFYIQNVHTKKKVTNMKVVTWKLGITTIEGICPAARKRR